MNTKETRPHKLEQKKDVAKITEIFTGLLA